MALRPLDNALPVISERPKKLAKVAAPTKNLNQKQPDLLVGVNDENMAPVPPPSAGDATVDYITSENLEAVADPDLKVQVRL